jgi:hypothetical protein
MYPCKLVATVNCSLDNRAVQTVAAWRGGEEKTLRSGEMRKIFAARAWIGAAAVDICGCAGAACHNPKNGKQQ